jgi:2-phosphoglycolate phosphatase
MPTSVVLFDFDGTLADSFDAITASTNHVRKLYGLEHLPEDLIRRRVGFGLEHLMQDLVPNAPTEEAVTRYREHHAATMLAGTRLMPGVAETLGTLHERGLRLGVCSNKRVEFTRQLVAALGLGRYFGAVLGPDDVEGRAKPDPSMLLEGVRRLEGSPAESLYVGDMAVDVDAARAGGLPVWLVLGGAAVREDVLQAAPDRVLEMFADIAKYL